MGLRLNCNYNIYKHDTRYHITKSRTPSLSFFSAQSRHSSQNKWFENCVQRRSHRPNRGSLSCSRVLPRIFSYFQGNGSRSYEDGPYCNDNALRSTQPRYSLEHSTRVQGSLHVRSNKYVFGRCAHSRIRTRVRSFKKAISSILLSDHKEMEYLVIGPGAMGGFSMLGYLKTIEKSLDNIKEYSGASAGAILVVFLALGFTVDEILYKLAELQGKNLIKLNLKCFMNKYGLIDLEPIRHKFIDIFESDPTFSEIDKKIYISAFCVNTSKTVYFSKDSHPDMKVIDAICMSIAVPFIFSSYRYQGLIYVDGGTVETLPSAPFLHKRGEKILCIRMKMQSEFIEDIKSPRQFAEALISSTLNNRQENVLKNCKVVDIDVGQADVFDFNMTYEEKMKLYLKGMQV